MSMATLVPAPRAKAPDIGLLVSTDNITRGEGRWMEGITYEPEGCQSGVIYDRCDVSPPSPDDDHPGSVEWQPYVLRVEDGCSTFSGWDHRKERANRLLQQQTETLLGRELWTGELAQTVTMPDTTDSPNTWLANVADVDILTESGPVGLVHGLACLQQYLADHNGGERGMIHATSQVVTHWESFRLLRREGAKILTMENHIVVPSPGYPGTSPTGAVGDQNIWAYATDEVEIFLGPISVPDLLDSSERLRNNATAVAERMALVHWQRCRHAGVRLDMEMCDSGGS